MLRLSRDMCDRFDKVRHAISTDIATMLMYDEIDFDMERSGFFERVRHLSGNEGASIHTMHLICDYIYWARESHIELTFTLSDEDYRRCLLTKEKGVYAEFLAHEELTALPIYSLMSQLGELAAVLSGELELKDADVLSQYIERDTLPKFMLYSAHQETVAPLLGAFQSLLLTNPAPASSVFFTFFAERRHREDDPELRVLVTFSETPWDEESIRPLTFTLG